MTGVVFVTPTGQDGVVAEQHHPWRELRQRADLRLTFDPLAADAGGAFYYRHGSFRLIVIDPALGRRERAAALAHELVHDEMGPCRMPNDGAIVCRDDNRVRSRVAEWLVPLDELAEVVDAMVGLGEGVTALEIADQFDTTEDVAQRALEMLAERWADGASA